jgi:hypothetical protein
LKAAAQASFTDRTEHAELYRLARDRFDNRGAALVGAALKKMLPDDVMQLVQEAIDNDYDCDALAHLLWQPD